MMKPFFSIIIPTFNSENTIKVAIESIISQTYNNYEIVIIDGASTDKTVELLKGYNNEKIKITTEKDKGIYDAMNKGIQTAKGEWLLFLGGDDSLYDNDVLMNIFQRAKNTSYKLIYGNVQLIGEAGWAKDQTIYDGEFNLEKICKKNICHQAIFYKHEIIKPLEYNLNYCILADYDLNLALWSKYKFQYVPLIISKYDMGGKSSQMVDYKFFGEFNDNLKKYFRFWYLIPDLFFLHKYWKIRKFMQTLKRLKP